MRSTNFTAHTWDALAVFGEAPPTIPRGIPLADQLLSSGGRKPRRFSLRPTWLAVAMAGIVGTIAGAGITVLSAPVVDW